MTESNKQTTRKDLMRPAQMLGMAAIAAVFAGVVAAISLGVFFRPARKRHQSAAAYEAQQSEIISQAVIHSLIIAGVVFIVVLLGISLLLLAVKPNDITRAHDTPMMYEREGRADTGVGGANEASAADTETTAHRDEKPDTPSS